MAAPTSGYHTEWYADLLETAADLLKSERLSWIQGQRIKAALNAAQSWGSSDGDHHKMWVIDQMVRELTGCPQVQFTAKDYKGVEYTYEGLGESDEYTAWVADHNQGEDGPYTYEWDKGIAP